MTTQLELERALCRELGINALDRDAVDYMLDRINERAFEAPVLTAEADHRGVYRSA